MALFFLFLFIGIILGLATGVIKHEDWIGVVGDVETSMIGAITGGTVFILLGYSMEDWFGALMVSFLTAVVFMGLMKRFINRGPTPVHR
jgi:uncharacterized membrane protein YeaQ/YmgE (transglycosylase-associated protein family)